MEENLTTIQKSDDNESEYMDQGESHEKAESDFNKELAFQAAQMIKADLKAMQSETQPGNVMQEQSVKVVPRSLYSFIELILSDC